MAVLPCRPMPSSPSPGPVSPPRPVFAEHTTLGVGGPARAWARCVDEHAVRAALARADDLGVRTFVLGGGSNLLVADRGYDGLVLRIAPTADGVRHLGQDGTRVRLRVDAGVGWDALVAHAVERGWAGLECLSGIPGRVGAAPIQNIGAYGQEISETVVSVLALDRVTLETERLAAADCDFGYRWSRFKGEWRDRYVILSVDLELRAGGAPTIRYAELERRLSGGAGNAGSTGSTGSAGERLAEVRRTVLDLRRAKSMVLDPDDPNRRSAGSFFVNPVVSTSQADRVAETARRRGTTRSLPRFAVASPAGDGGSEPGESLEKLSAAWLIEEAGFERGHRLGRAGLSTRHTLALTNRGGATADELVALARQVRQRVRQVFGVTLVPEPVFLGFEKSVEELLG